MTAPTAAPAIHWVSGFLLCVLAAGCSPLGRPSQPSAAPAPAPEAAIAVAQAPPVPLPPAPVQPAASQGPAPAQPAAPVQPPAVAKPATPRATAPVKHAEANATGRAVAKAPVPPAGAADQAGPAVAPPAPPPKEKSPAAAEVKPAAPPLDLASLESRLKETRAIGLFTKLSLKNQVDDLLGRFRMHHAGQPRPTLGELRPAFELLMLKVLTLLQDGDPPLAQAIVASRDAIWDILADPKKFANANLMAGEVR